MRDTKIKGTGNSRSIKSVPNLSALAPTYEGLLALLTGEGLPIDLGALNPAGCQQIGDDLDKANLLSDSTAALYSGLPENPVPDDVFSNIWQYLLQISGKAVVAAGTYTGTGMESNSIQLGFYPKAVLIIRLGFDAMVSSGNYYGGLAVRGGDVQTTAFSVDEHANVILPIIKLTSNGFTVFRKTVKTSTAGYTVEAMTNLSNSVFHYFAIG